MQGFSSPIFQNHALRLASESLDSALRPQVLGIRFAARSGTSPLTGQLSPGSDWARTAMTSLAACLWAGCPPTG